MSIITDTTRTMRRFRIAALRGVILSVSVPKMGRPTALKMAKTLTRVVATALSMLMISVPTGFEMPMAMSPARHPMM